jgi:mono/diheme cytochrome c family protein
MAGSRGCFVLVGFFRFFAYAEKNSPPAPRIAGPSLLPAEQGGSVSHRANVMKLAPRHLLLLAALLPAAPATASAADRTGAQIYKELCARCHGMSGEGTKDQPKVLAGDLSIEQLATVIDKTMPEGEPEKCVGEDAKAVAAYIHEAFYYPIAQARIQPPRVELSRLTVRQYQNVLTDLIGSFRQPSRWEEPGGLRGEYYKGRRTRGGDRVMDRIDPVVQFDFGEGSPEPEKMEAHEFSIRWEGSLLAPESGLYEFVVKTEHATRLWVNDNARGEDDRPLIDAWVKSGSDTEYRGSIRLLGGRVYPLKLEFSKAKQGVDDSKTQKKPPPPRKASIALEWKTPSHAQEVIPARCLSRRGTPEVFVCETPFPPDDRSIGYERGSSISKAWDQATTEGALETTSFVLEHLRELAGTEILEADAGPRLREFCYKLAERAFRRPLSPEQRRLYVDRQFELAGEPELAMKRVLLLIFKSPRFLYREVGALKPDAYDVASRISFGLWDSAPDEELLKRAAAGELTSREQISAQVHRMLPDLRTRTKLMGFFLQLLKVDQAPDIAKDSAAFPEFSPQVASDLRTSLELTLEEVIGSEKSDFRELLLGESTYLNGRLARLYGTDLIEDSPFQKMTLDDGQRAGVITHPYLLSAFAYTSTSSPIHRGVLISRSLLGRTLRPPPEAVAPLAPDLHPDLTTRERVLLQTKDQACQTCHAMINPIGFSLENFDAIGRYREQEKDKPVDASGSYLTRSGETVQFSGPVALAKFLASSPEVHRSTVERLFHYLMKQPIGAYGSAVLPRLCESFTKKELNLKELTADIVIEAALAPGK